MVRALERLHVSGQTTATHCGTVPGLGMLGQQGPVLALQHTTGNAAASALSPYPSGARRTDASFGVGQVRSSGGPCGAVNPEETLCAVRALVVNNIDHPQTKRESEP